jgi:hypothetical protein
MDQRVSRARGCGWSALVTGQWVASPYCCHPKWLFVALAPDSSDGRGKCLETIAPGKVEHRLPPSHRGRGMRRNRSSSRIWWLIAVGVTPSSAAALLEAQVPCSRVEGAQLDERRQLVHVRL